MPARKVAVCAALVWACLAAGAARSSDTRRPRDGRKPAPAVVIDAAKTGEPISKYIYGQFIEHMGRCVNGGIWSEMLLDRKFFAAAGDRKSPWRLVGGRDAVSMARENAYVGRHSPLVKLPGDGKPRGIIQAGLGLIKDREYAGRIVLAGSAGAAPVEVALIWGKDAGERRTIVIRQIKSEFAKLPLAFTAGADTDSGALEITSRGTGRLRIGTVSLMPADNVGGFDPGVLKLMKQLNAPVYRWPGGNFVSGYDWTDGIGDRDRRPPRWERAWKAVEPNDVGVHEFLSLCELLGAEPYITVNSGLGDAASAAREVEYVNGDAETAMGKLRARNGHARPFGVRWWGIGNEMYGKWQQGYMPPGKYVEKHNRFAEAMREVDPSIKLLAVGQTGAWDQQMLSRCAGAMDLITEHVYPGPVADDLKHVPAIARAIKAKADAHRRYRKTIARLKGKDIRIAMDEWNYWYGRTRPWPYGLYGCDTRLRDALGIAAGLHEFIRNCDIYFMANYSITVNVYGAINRTKTRSGLAATALPLMLYRGHFGAVPVEVTGRPQPLDVAAAWTRDRKALTIAIVNPAREKLRLSVDLKGAALSGRGRRRTITGPDAKACNQPGKDAAVRITEETVSGISNKLDVPRLSVCMYTLTVQ